MTLTRALAHRLRAVFRRCRAGSDAELPSLIVVRTGPDGLRVQLGGGAPVEYHQWS